MLNARSLDKALSRNRLAVTKSSIVTTGTSTSFSESSPLPQFVDAVTEKHK